jgi:hypothetical protein
MKMGEIDRATNRLLSQIATTDRGKKEFSIITLGAGTRPFSVWSDPCNLPQFDSWIASDIAQVRKRMHARRRAEDRALINKFVKANEERRKSKEYKRLLSSIFSRFRKPMDELVLEDGELLVDPIKIHDKLNDYMQQWHSRNTQTKSGVDWLRALEDRDYLMGHQAFSKVPEHLRGAIADSLRVHNRNTKLQNDMATSLAKEITYTEFKDTIIENTKGIFHISCIIYTSCCQIHFLIFTLD